MAEEKKPKGRIAIQKMKPYLVYDYLMRRTDTNHVASGNEIAAYLQGCGILQSADLFIPILKK